MSSPNEENLYLKNAIKKLAVGIEGLTDDDGDLIVQTVQSFDLPYPTTDTWFVFNPRRMTMTEESAGFPSIKQTWNIPAKLCIGTLGGQYGGTTQATIWERTPTVINFIETHPHLQFEGSTDLPQYLDTTVGVKIQQGSISTETEKIETGTILVTHFVIIFPFELQRTIIKYQDGQLVEVY